MHVEFWIDPLCPWCWQTARWVVCEVEPERDLDITWKPISLLFKDDPPPGRYRKIAEHTRKLLRVFVALDESLGNQAAFDFYWEAGKRIHHEGDREVPAATVLEDAGLEPSFAEAYDDAAWDDRIRSLMEEGLDLVGEEVGTPIIGFGTGEERVGVFGPIISRVPRRADGVAFWDAMVTMATFEGFWELKRTRTEGPQFGDPPD